MKLHASIIARKKMSAVATVTKGETFTYHMLYKTGHLLPSAVTT